MCVYDDSVNVLEGACVGGDCVTGVTNLISLSNLL